MKRYYKWAAALLLAAGLVLCAAVPAALAAGATEVILNQTTLNAATPYWTNNTTKAVAYTENWNAYFDASTATLTLQDAQINQYSYLATYYFYDLIRANGDLTIVLAGDSYLEDTSTKTANSLVGLFVDGNLTVYGSGSLNFTAETLNAAGVYILGDEFLLSNGSIIIDGVLESGGGISAPDATLRITGGFLQITVQITGKLGKGVYANAFEMTGGTVALRATGTAENYGLSLRQGTVSITGGEAVFVGETSALHGLVGAQSPQEPEDGMMITVSESIYGTGLQQWYSAADGVIMTVTEQNTGDVVEQSPFQYARFYESSEETQNAVMPQTGDESRPLLWAVVATLAMLAAAAAVYILLQKKNENE